MCRIPSLGVGVADADRCSGHLSDSRTVSGPCWKRAKKVPLVFTREPGGPLQDWGSARSRLRLIRARSPETSRRPEARAPDGSRRGVRSRRQHLPPPPPGVCGSWRPGPEPLQGATVPFGPFGAFGPPPPPRAMGVTVTCKPLALRTGNHKSQTQLFQGECDDYLILVVPLLPSRERWVIV